VWLELVQTCVRGIWGIGAAASAAASASVSLPLAFALALELFEVVETLALILFGRLGRAVSFLSPRLSFLTGDCLAGRGGVGGGVEPETCLFAATTLMLRFSTDGLAEGVGELYADSDMLRSERGRETTLILVSMPS
jgi:hypothetical protein